MKPRNLVAVALLAGLFAVTLADRAEAFCGFYVSGSNSQLVNRATRVALMRRGTRTVLTMSNDYDGPPENFAMVVPVPVVLQQENVRTLQHDVFDRIEQLTAPRLVEYWEQDPCPSPQTEQSMRRPGNGMAAGATTAAPSAAPARDLGVRIEARFTVGEYQILVLSATQSSGLERWLLQEHYNIPQGAAEYLAPYVREQSKFFVARVDITRAQRRPNGGARLSPLRFHYDSQDFRLPVRLGLLNATEAQDLIVYVLHDSSRFEVANYPNVFIPSNLQVSDPVRSQFAPFYAQLFDSTIAAAGGRAVVTEYAWTSASCDPCPTPPMQSGELSVLGGDVIAAGNGAASSPQSMVVTRLHTRYNRATLTEDLIFREAAAVVGGREMGTDANGETEQGAQPSSTNNFQARYIIRHPWTGAIACRNPRRGVWGGPPGGVQPAPVAARNLAEVVRGSVVLASVVRTPVPTLSITGHSGPSAGVRTPVRVVIPPSAHKPSGRLSFDWRLGLSTSLAFAMIALAFRRKR